jgi:hypothetical protein
MVQNVLEHWLMVDKPFTLSLPQLLQEMMILIKVMLEVITKMKYYSILEKPYLVPLSLKE